MLGCIFIVWSNFDLDKYALMLYEGVIMLKNVKQLYIYEDVYILKNIFSHICIYI